MDGCGGCTPRCAGAKLLVAGLLLVVNYYYFRWDPWLLVGVLLTVKGLLKMVWPNCGCHTDEAVVVKKRR